MQESIKTSFNRGSTAQEVAEGTDLAGKFAVITGGSTGLGKETARVLANAGADVFLGARDDNKLASAKAELVEGGAKNIFTHSLDLIDPGSVKRFAEAVLELDRPIDILVNNAGIMACPLAYSEQGIESQLATNYVGHALLTSLLAPALKRANRARLVSLTSCAHHLSQVVFDDLNFKRRDYDAWVAYGQSKTASSLLAVKAAKHLGEHGVTSLAVQPGAIRTELMRYMSAEEQSALLDSLIPEEQKTSEKQRESSSIFKTVEAGAATSVWAVCAPELEGKGPLYLEDCKVAPAIDQPNQAYGVLPYALDPNLADQLWAEAERMLNQKLPL